MKSGPATTLKTGLCVAVFVTVGPVTTANTPTDKPNVLQLAQAKATVSVLVTVKASPQPSAGYGDTVCVAGVLMVDRPRWIRLYPVPFRYLEGAQQFSKYAMINVQLHESTKDRRPESSKIVATSLVVGDVLPPWKRRADWVEPLVGPTMCELNAGVKSNPDATSLGAIRPAKVDPFLKFEAHGPWTPEQLNILTAEDTQESLFGPPAAAMLEPPRLKVRLRYWCLAPACNGHTQRIIDWELTALQRRGRGLDDTAMRASIQAKFMEQMFSPDRDPLIFVGNQAAITRRQSFTVLGIYYPPRRTPPEPSLF